MLNGKAVNMLHACVYVCQCKSYFIKRFSLNATLMCDCFTEIGLA